VASRYRCQGLPFEDLVQEGAVGLLEAIDHFDPRRGAPFEPYARFRVRRAIRNALTNQARLIRLPKHVVDRRRAIDRAEARLLAAGCRPTSSELAAATGLSPGSVLEARSAAGTPVSLDEPLWSERAPLASVIKDPQEPDPVEVLLRRDEAASLAEALAKLTPRQRRVVSARWGLCGARPTSAVELGRELQLSPRRAQTIGDDALYVLRRELESPETIRNKPHPRLRVCADGKARCRRNT
jgi:RNA polymerase primary sigma factor